MSIVSTDIVAYSCSNVATDDVGTAGGPLDGQYRVVFTQFTSAAKMSLTSDGTDTRTVTIKGRDATGTVVSENVVLTSAVEVLSVNTYERIQRVNLDGTDLSRTVTAKQGAGGSVITAIPPNEIGFRMMFQNAFSSSTTKTRYDKIVFENNHSLLTLSNVKITLTVDVSGKLTAGIETVMNDNQSITNRLNAPTDPTFVSVGTAQSIPGGIIDSTRFIGVWIKQSLGINDPAQKNSFTMQLTGTTV